MDKALKMREGAFEVIPETHFWMGFNSANTFMGKGTTNSTNSGQITVKAA